MDTDRLFGRFLGISLLAWYRLIGLSDGKPKKNKKKLPWRFLLLASERGKLGFPLTLCVLVGGSGFCGDGWCIGVVFHSGLGHVLYCQQLGPKSTYKVLYSSMMHIDTH